MFKNTDLFNGSAEDMNSSIEKVNEACKRHGINATYDVVLLGNMTEDKVEDEGWLDCIGIQKDGEIVSDYLTCDEALAWMEGFLECMEIYINETNESSITV